MGTVLYIKCWHLSVSNPSPRVFLGEVGNDSFVRDQTQCLWGPLAHQILQQWWWRAYLTWCYSPEIQKRLRCTSVRETNLETETTRTKAIGKAQRKRNYFLFLRRSGIFHRGDMLGPKKKKKTSKESISNDIVFNLEICQLCREIFFAHPSEHTEGWNSYVSTCIQPLVFKHMPVLSALEGGGGDMFPLFLDFLKLIFIGVQLFHNVVLVSGIQQSELAIHTYIFPLFLDFLPF